MTVTCAAGSLGPHPAADDQQRPRQQQPERSERLSKGDAQAEKQCGDAGGDHQVSQRLGQHHGRLRIPNEGGGGQREDADQPERRTRRLCGGEDLVGLQSDGAQAQQRQQRDADDPPGSDIARLRLRFARSPQAATNRISAPTAASRPRWWGSGEESVQSG